MFSTAKRLAQADWNIFLLAETAGPVQARGGFPVCPHFTIDDHPPIDVLLVAGGIHTGELEKPAVIEWIANVASSAERVASVCTGAFLLAEAGRLDGLPVTTHWEDIPNLKARYPALEVLENQRWVNRGNTTTSGGISAGIDMSLSWFRSWRLRNWPNARRGRWSTAGRNSRKAPTIDLGVTAFRSPRRAGLRTRAPDNRALCAPAIFGSLRPPSTRNVIFSTLFRCCTRSPFCIFICWMSFESNQPPRITERKRPDSSLLEPRAGAVFALAALVAVSQAC
ncbi:DJ-1/PfpI family protein [Microbulbifer halophilus]|uniref:DJ-1/PfpI family protein n=1 Tax=Microbulbifer halophilus TaxID=453963 RepID=UPI003607524D